MKRPKPRKTQFRLRDAFCCNCGKLLTAENRGDTIRQRNGATERGCKKCAPIREAKA